MIRILMRPGVLRRGAAAFASIFSDRTQFVLIALFPRWLLGDRVICLGMRYDLLASHGVVLVMVLFRFDFTAPSGIWEAVPHAATCASTPTIQSKNYLWITESESMERF